MSRSFRTRLLGLVTASALVGGGCGAEGPAPADSTTNSAESTETGTPQPDPTAETSPEDQPAKEPAESGTTIDITFEGDSVTPSGVSQKARVGKPVTLHIVADAPGELHVHSSPEQEVAYLAGTSDHVLVIEQPGLVDVEAHELDRLVVQLEVR